MVGPGRLVPTTEWMEQCHDTASALLPCSFSSEAFASGSESEERGTLLQGPPSHDDLVSLLMERLKAAQERESSQRNSLNFINRGLLCEVQNAKEREAELLQERNQFEADAQAFREEMVYVINGSIIMFRSISDQLLDLIVALQNFQTGEQIPIPRAPVPSQEMPTTLLACAEEVTNKINFARSALDEAVKQWNDAVAGLEMMQSVNRKRLMATILGKEQPIIAESDIAGEETTAGLKQVALNLMLQS